MSNEREEVYTKEEWDAAAPKKSPTTLKDAITNIGNLPVHVVVLNVIAFAILAWLVVETDIFITDTTDTLVICNSIPHACISEYGVMPLDGVDYDLAVNYLKRQ